MHDYSLGLVTNSHDRDLGETAGQTEETAKHMQV